MSAINNYDGGLTLSMPVKDLDASIDWYTEILGFKLLYRVDDIGWCELQSSVENVNVGLSQVENPQPGGATPTFGVDDIQTAQESLRASGANLEGEVITYPGMVKLLNFYDPDGNSLMLFEALQDD